MKNLPFYALLFLSSFILFSCSNDDDSGYTPVDNDPVVEDPFADLNLPEEYFNYANINLPDHYLVNYFPDQAQFQRAAIDLDNTPANNPTTDAGATLGRVLFYDKKLSANGTVSCASCHQQEFGFSDPNILSDGFDGGKTRRHSMGIVNARFYFSGKFFWDERASTLEEQVLMPFQDEVEMGLTLEQLEEIARDQVYYPRLFTEAFGDETINSDRISKALAQFIRSMVSTTSKYDIARSQVQSPIDDFPTFTNQENRGKDLFYLPIEAPSGARINCAGCHISEAFVGSVPNGGMGTTTSTNNGLDAVSASDLGIYETTNNQNDIGKFKTPSLRNIAIRPPYMHDGRFASLRAVIDHYSEGVQNHMNLANSLKDDMGNPVRLNLTDADKEALIAFLETLTDEEMLSDEKYSNPFK